MTAKPSGYGLRPSPSDNQSMSTDLADALAHVLRCPRGADSFVPDRDGIWDAMGGAHAPRTLAQLSNVVPPTPQLYERVWRTRSVSLLSHGTLTLQGELAALRHWMPTEGVLADIGCSEGLYARTMAAAGATVVAVDHSRPFLRRVGRHAAGLAVAPVRALAQRLPIDDGVLDGVMIGGSLNEIGDLVGAVSEMGRVTKPGGRLFSMSLVQATGTKGRLLQSLLGLTGIVFPTVARTQDLFERAGFQIETCDRDGIVLRIAGTRASGSARWRDVTS